MRTAGGQGTNTSYLVNRAGTQQGECGVPSAQTAETEPENSGVSHCETDRVTVFFKY